MQPPWQPRLRQVKPPTEKAGEPLGARIERAGAAAARRCGGAPRAAGERSPRIGLAAPRHARARAAQVKRFAFCVSSAQVSRYNRLAHPLTVYMDSIHRHVALLAGCQAMLLAVNSTLIAINGLAGLALAPMASLPTLPVTCWVIGGALTTAPASLFME